MKTISLTTALWLMTAVVCYGQASREELIRNTMEALDRERQRKTEALDRKRQRKLEYDRAIEAGRRLFGADERWRGDKPDDLALRKPPTDFRIGDWGCTIAQFEVLSVVSNTECLVLPVFAQAEPMLLRGLDMSKVTDGATFILQHPVVIQETYTYKAVSGARKTILVLDVNKEKVGKEIAKLRAAAEAKQAAELAAENAKQEINQRIEHAKWRTWSCADGKFTIGAKFMGVISGVVTLEKTDGQRIQVGLDRLSKDDQAFIRDRKWLSPAATVAAPATPQIAADRPRSPSVAVPLDLKDCVLLLTFDRDTLTATGAGLAIRDLSPRGNNCVVSGASLVDGKVGTALAFDGKGDHVLLTGLREDLVEDTTGLTVAMWFLPRGMRRTNFLFDMGEPTRQTPNSVVRMLFEPDQRGGISLLFAVVGTGTRVVPSLSGRWHHLVGTWDSAQLRVFLDGELLGEQVKKSGALTSASVGPSAARLGSEATGTGGPDGKSRNFAGAIDEFLVLRRALSSAEVTELYQMGVDGRTLSLGP